MTWRLVVLGASSTLTTHGDSHASLLLTAPNRSVLIDAGGNVPALVESVGEDFRQISDVIVTHSHPDHTYGLPFLSHCFYHGSAEVRCWSTSEAIPRLRASLEAYDLQEPDRYLDVEFREVPTEAPEELPLLEGVALTSLPTEHSRPGFGLSLKSPNQRIVFSGDTTPTTSIEEHGKGADVLLHDCQATEAYKRYFRGSHTSAGALGRMASRLQPNVLVPFHTNLVEFPITWDDMASEIRRHFQGTVLQPFRGMGFVL